MTLKKRRFIQVGLFAWVVLLSLAVTSPGVCDARDGGEGVAAAALVGVCRGAGRNYSLVVAGEAGSAGAGTGDGGAGLWYCWQRVGWWAKVEGCEEAASSDGDGKGLTQSRSSFNLRTRNFAAVGEV